VNIKINALPVGDKIKANVPLDMIATYQGVSDEWIMNQNDQYYITFWQLI